MHVRQLLLLKEMLQETKLPTRRVLLQAKLEMERLLGPMMSLMREIQTLSNLQNLHL